MSSYYLRNWTVHDLLHDEQRFHLEYIDDEDTVYTALHKMKAHNISSLPVRAQKTNHFIGILDVLDLVTFCCSKYQNISLQAWDSYQQMEGFAKTQVKYILDLSGRNKWVVIGQHRPLIDLINLLSNPHLHRVGVVDDRGTVVGLVSQSKVLAFLYKYSSCLEDNLRVLLSETMDSWIPTHHKNVYTINMNDSVYSAFYRIWEREVSGLAVVDDHGRLVANISASDIKRTRFYPIVGQMVQDLYQPIRTFLRIPPQGTTRFKKKDHIPMYVTHRETLGYVLQLIVERHIHRIFVVDNHFKPIAVVSLCDFLKQFAHRARR